ncbi:3-deoxy-7-phosphoheptulonate synthase [Syncephalis pseudoplumigaleata]|uniref:Phospho-2-dehydro-3-deoxyheptonate aldolase n=1 Tax=Syncephalis pseudoplumigaleata TaxID=1712513 RepID=A0A4P9YVD2_9FUNG|nr:3-deoxy-7-phosphoheptulonate synthase [Syncephalis pseudoplumigaleata]|eukprot:RKP23986.1 3-deoxy-7-phosphoheptulonate synthase [Syncephalis pseudoplumigaleata]
MSVESKNTDGVEYFDDLRIDGYDPLIPPQILQQDHPLVSYEESKVTIARARRDCCAVVNREDDRLLVIVGPCSIHDPKAALIYGNKLKELADKHKQDLVIVMRAYFEKPRTTVGWKGLINDPDIDGRQINHGLRVARQLLCDLTHAGIPVGCELLDTISPQFIGDLISWGAIGARTTESQLHRELASGVSFPVGFKNGTDGNSRIAIDAIRASSHPHHFLGVTKQGLAAITNTKGNDYCHIILRGGSGGPNYEKPYVDQVRAELEKAKLRQSIMVDCSHGNSRKVFSNQVLVAADLAQQVAAGDASITGVMIESNLVEGRQDVPEEGPAGLTFGQSITDACISFDTTIGVIDQLAAAVRARRAALQSQ